MLTDEEKLKIELQERYRNEIASKFQSKSKIDFVETGIKILQGLAIVIGIWATYNEFRKQNDEKRVKEAEQKEQARKEFQQTAKEFSKNFYQKQFEYYVEATEATATLATEEPGSTDYKEAKKKFDRLYWGRLSIVEDKCVEAKMVEFKRLLMLYELGSKQGQVFFDSCRNEQIEIAIADQDALQGASLRLARDARRYILTTWLDSTERTNYRIR